MREWQNPILIAIHTKFPDLLYFVSHDCRIRSILAGRLLFIRNNPHNRHVYVSRTGSLQDFVAEVANTFGSASNGSESPKTQTAEILGGLLT